jgi:hypothetical protein
VRSERASVIEVLGVAWSAGAPQPVVLTSESRTFIAFFGREDSVGEDQVITAEFVGCTSINTGFPNDEVLHGHRLWGRGLTFYRVHEVLNSSWLAELRSIEAVHPRSPSPPFPNARHFVLTFHDSTVEAIATDLIPIASHSSMRQAISSLEGELTDELPI